MDHLVLTVVTILLCSGLQHLVNCSGTGEKDRRATGEKDRLQSRLLTYGGNVADFRPDGEDPNAPLMVNMSFSPVRLVDVDRIEGFVKIFGYLLFTWKNPALAYDNGNYHDIDMIRLDVSKIWTPDIELFDSDSRIENLVRTDKVLVYPTGDIFWMLKSTLIVYCQDASRNQLDNCNMKFGSWTYDGTQIDLGVSSEVDLNDFVPSARWEIASASAKRGVKTYSCCPEPYPFAEFSFRVARR